MSFNLTVVAFGKEPDTSAEKILEYRGFDPVLVGLTTQGTQHFYTVKTDVEGAQVIHVQIRDEQVDSPNMVLVLENLLPPANTDPRDIPQEALDKLSAIIAETTRRLGLTDISQLEGPWSACGVTAFTFLDVRKPLADDLAKAERTVFLQNN